MQESTLQMTVVGNLLVAVDKGKAHEFERENIRYITLDGMKISFLYLRASEIDRNSFL